jgi:secondary thiamine-phosphate synthase enzyme
MRSHTEHLMFNTKKVHEYVNITDRVAGAVSKSGVREGLCLVSAMHITAGVYVNDDEPGFRADLDALLERLAPAGADYRHHETGETNGDAHLKSILSGYQVTLPISEGRLDLGPWQQVFYAEFDGQRRKRVLVKVIGE